MKDEFLSILHAPDFTSVLSHHTYSGELAEIMKFYVNLRDAVQNKGGGIVCSETGIRCLVFRSRPAGKSIQR